MNSHLKEFMTTVILFILNIDCYYNETPNRRVVKLRLVNHLKIWLCCCY